MEHLGNYPSNKGSFQSNLMPPTVIITGASQGIGKATAQIFARHGYNIVLSARQDERLEAVAQELRSSGHAAIAIPADVKEIEQVQTLVQKTLQAYTTIDVLVNNAGIFLSGPVEQFSLNDWHEAIDTNLWGYIHTIHTLLPHFLERGSGTIVNISSIGGVTAMPYHVPYSTSKFAVSGLTKALHAELAPKGIHVCGIYPSLIKSDLMERAVFRGKDTEDVRDRYNQVDRVLQIPLIEKPEDVAKAVWDGVKQKQAEVLVGSAKVSAGINHFFPSLMQQLVRRTFKNRDH